MAANSRRALLYSPRRDSSWAPAGSPDALGSTGGVSAPRGSPAGLVVLAAAVQLVGAGEVAGRLGVDRRLVGLQRVAAERQAVRRARGRRRRFHQAPAVPGTAAERAQDEGEGPQRPGACPRPS